MKLLSLLAVPLVGFICVIYGLLGKSVSRKGERAAVLERVVTISGGLLLIATGLSLALFVFRVFFK
jgi:hypothetical protein